MQLGMRALVKRAELIRARTAGKTTLLPAVGNQRHLLSLIAESIITEQRGFVEKENVGPRFPDDGPCLATHPESVHASLQNSVRG